jgi:hypothetical protein
LSFQKEAAKMRFAASTIFVVMICSCGVAGLCHATQTATDSIDLSIEFEKSPRGGPPNFVFINGRLSGVVPGIFALRSGDTVPIEVGVAQLTYTPLYSFVFGPNQLENKTTIVIQTNLITSTGGKLTLAPNTANSIPISKITENRYAIKLPDSQFDPNAELESYFHVRRQTNIPVYAEIPVQKSRAYPDSEFTRGNLHVTHDTSTNAMIFSKQAKQWSGARVTNYNVGILHSPYRPETERWTVESTPEGASIITSEGEKGMTNSTIDVNKSLSEYVVVKKEGYMQCPEEECKKQETASGSITLTCVLKSLSAK